VTGTSAVLTLLFTDIEGSTLMWEQEAKKMEAAVAIHFELLQRAIMGHHGTVVKNTGDGVFATFTDPLEAVRAVAAAQRELTVTDWPGEQVRVRMGLHTGSCSSRDGDHYGRAVNKAARVEQSAYGGQVLLSGTTASLVRDDLDEGLSLVYVGEHYFDGIIDPEQVYQLSVSGLDNEHPPLRTRDIGLEQLPLERSGLVGRGEVTPLLEEELGRSRVVSLVGPPGVGKSRLALRVATEVARERDNGVRFIDLAPCRRIDAAAGTIATALGVHVREESTVVEGIIRGLRSTDTLVVLDNCEHLLPAVTPLVDTVIATCPRVTLLTTSRERLGVESEFVWSVRPLALPPRDATTLAEIEGASSVQLLVERASAVAPELALTDADTASIVEICHRCDGLPLAVELAAAALERLALVELLAALDKSLDAFERPGGRPAIGRHGGLREALDTSYDALSDLEQAVFDELAAFAGFASADAIASVVRVPDAAGVRDVLDALARRSLLVVERSGGVTRYRQLESVRQYSVEHGRVDDELRLRHALHFVDEAEARGRQYLTSEGSLAARMMAEQFDDFRLAVNRLVERERWRDATRIVVALHAFCLFSMRTEQQTWALGLEGRLPNEDPLAAELLGVIAVGAWFRGDHDRALTAGAEALAAAEHADGPVSTKWARTALLNASAFLSDYDAALVHLPRLTAECRATGDPYWIVNALAVEAIGSASVGLHEQAVAPAAKAMRIAEELGNADCLYWASYAQAVTLRPTDLDGAEAALDRALAAARSNGSRFNEGVVLMEQLGVQVERGDVASAAATALDLLGHLERAGGFGQVWQAVLLASRVLAAQGRDEAAAVLLLAVVDRPNLLGGAAGLSVDELQRTLRERLGDDELDHVRGRVRFLTDSQIVELCQRELERVLRG
jgi:predicted ATPase/class 3 adenylate cyclase